MKNFFTKKKIIWTVIILLVVGPIAYNIFKPKDNSKNIQTDIVKRQDLKRTVLATGQVVSSTDLQLSFKSSGPVASVLVKEGNKVKAGQVLASLDQKDQIASLTSARGALAQANANYNKVLSGASSEDVAVTKVALDSAKSSLENTKKQQQVLVDNAYKAVLNSSLEAVPEPGNINDITLTISGTYNSTETGIYQIIQEGQSFYVRGLETAGNISINTSVPTPLALGTRGLYVQFPSTVVVSTDKWTVKVPNTSASTYITTYNAYQSALETQRSAVAAAENAVASAQAALDLKKAQARPADVQAAEAQILSAQGQVQAASSALENTIIRAPADGTITSVDIKVGELATALKEAIVLQDIGNLHVEANVSEANIASLRESQDIDITFDALGPDRLFKGKVQTINPASTVVSGVVNYKVTASLENVADIKPGMTANMTVLTGEKPAVLAVPSRAIINNGKKVIRVIDDPKKKTYHEVEVTTGLEADGGLVEITSGVSEGQEVVTFIKK